jgi:thermolysin
MYFTEQRMRLVKLLLLAAAVAIVSRGGIAPAVRAQARPTAVAATSPADLRVWDAAVDRMTRDGDLRLRRSAEDTLMPGRVHERLDQVHRGVRVFGGDVARQTSSGLTVSIFGTIYPDIDIDVTPALSADEAIAIVERLSGIALGPGRVPELVILPGDDGGYRLTYRAKAFTAADGYEYFIDATSGALIRAVSAAQRQTGSATIGRGVGVLGDDKKVSVTASSGTFLASDLLRPPSLRTYDMRGNLTRVLNVLNEITRLTTSDLASSTSTTFSDGVTVDAHANAGFVYDFYFKRFGRRGLDNNNIQLDMLIHPVRRQDLTSQPSEVVGLFYLNAFYAGDGLMVFGEGLPPGFVSASDRQSWNYLAGGLDVLAHELTHGVTEFSSNLIYRNESGALNEAFSDMMGTATEFYYQPPGDGPLKADYLVAEDVVTPGGLRSMANPAVLGDPDHYTRRFVGTADNGGVHTNSTIASHAYYLAIEGGTNRTSGLGVTGVGTANREQIEKTFYRGFTQLLPSNATFAVARAATIQAARDLYGAGGAVERAVTQAWTAVGVN